jgi:hypothetical protein
VCRRHQGRLLYSHLKEGIFFLAIGIEILLRLRERKKERKKWQGRAINQFKRLETWLFKTEGKILIPLFPFGHGGETSASW